MVEDEDRARLFGEAMDATNPIRHACNGTPPRRNCSHINYNRGLCCVPILIPVTNPNLSVHSILKFSYSFKT